MDRIYRPFYNNFMISNKGAALLLPLARTIFEFLASCMAIHALSLAWVSSVVIPSLAEKYLAAMHRIFDEWEWDAILPCHGTFIASGGKQQLRKHLNLPPPQLIRGR